jgi:hypothetical protein
VEAAAWHAVWRRCSQRVFMNLTGLWFVRSSVHRKTKHVTLVLV